MAYVGEYQERLRDGHGAYTFPGGSFRYEGEWKRGRMHGRGVFSLSDGGSYEGEFVNGEIDGIGLRRWPDGSTFNGQFHRGERHGEGVHITSEGEVYEGHWVNNQRHGLGELRLVNGDVYRGDFYKHKPHGNGRIKFAKDGSSYDGDWVEGKICGRGVLKDAKAMKLYDGEWFNGQRCGKGVGRLHALDGSATEVVYDGVWTNDSPLAPTRKLGFKVVVPLPQAVENADPKDNEIVQVEYQDAPAVLTLEKKTCFVLPHFAVASLDESQENETSVVASESGRRLRLRVFEGPVPTPVAPSPRDENAGESQPPPAQWYFTAAPKPAPSLGESLPLAEVEPVVADPELPVIEEVRLSKIEATNGLGVAVFDKLAMPPTSLLGSYHIVCENLSGGDSIELAYLSLQLVE